MNTNPEVASRYSNFYFTSCGLVKLRSLTYTLSISSFLKYVTAVEMQKFHLCQVILDKSAIWVILIIQGCFHLLHMPNDRTFAGS